MCDWNLKYKKSLSNFFMPILTKRNLKYRIVHQFFKVQRATTWTDNGEIAGLIDNIVYTLVRGFMDEKSRIFFSNYSNLIVD